MASRKRVVEKIVEEQADPKDSPTVVAYRLGELEKAVINGFESQSKYMQDMIRGFVTEKEFSDAKSDSDKEHAALWAEFRALKLAVKWWVGTILLAVGAAAAVIGLFK